MKYKIIDLEGVGEAYAEKFRAVGIATVDEYLKRCRTPQERKALADETGIAPSLIMKFANHADLMRVEGVGPQFAELLEAAGVDTVKELRTRNASNLETKLTEINDKRHLTGRVPSEEQLKIMIERADILEPFLMY